MGLALQCSSTTENGSRDFIDTRYTTGNDDDDVAIATVDDDDAEDANDDADADADEIIGIIIGAPPTDGKGTPAMMCDGAPTGKWAPTPTPPPTPITYPAGMGCCVKSGRFG